MYNLCTSNLKNTSCVWDKVTGWHGLVKEVVSSLKKWISKYKMLNWESL